MMVDQFVETWRIHNRVHLKLLDEISDEGLSACLSKEKRAPARQFAHIHNVRIWKLEQLDEELTETQTKFTPKDDLTRNKLRRRLIESGEAIENILREGFENDGEVDGYRRGVTTLQGYLISHESHHRGNILLTLKECGYELPRSLMYDIWDWNKI